MTDYELNQEAQEYINYQECVYRMFETEDGKVIKAQFEKMLMEPTWVLGMREVDAIYCEGSHSMLRALLNIHDEVSNRGKEE